MTDDIIRIEGHDLGIPVGFLELDGHTYSTKGRVTVYKPQNDTVPSTRMGFDTLQQTLPSIGSNIRHEFPYGQVRQVLVDDTVVWKNRDHFEVESMMQDYAGRGKITVELIGPQAFSTATFTGTRDMGFRKVLPPYQ